MQLEETIAKELAGIIKEQTAKCIDQTAAVREALIRTHEVFDARLKTVENENGAPADVTDEIAKAIAMLAEAPPLTQASGHPVVVNFSPPNSGKKIKTITTRRDEAGNLVARVIED